MELNNQVSQLPVIKELQDNYKILHIEHEIHKVKSTASMKAMHKRLDESGIIQLELNRTLIKHMEGEDEHHLEVARHMAKTNQLLEHLSTKEAVTKVNGRINTIWTIGGAVLLCLGLASSYFIVEGFKSHVTNTIEKVKK